MDAEGFKRLDDFLEQPWLNRLTHFPFTNEGIEADMLRLDLVHPLISGNKWLKLDHWLKEYNKGHYKGILTPGGPWSNHLHACAFACYQKNIPFMAVIKGHNNLNTPLMEDIRRWNGNIRFADRSLFYSHDLLNNLAKESGYLLIPLGGEGSEGEAGVTDWMNHLPLPGYDWIACATGTATTLAGIAKSNLKFKTLLGFDPGTGDKNIPIRVSALNNQDKEKEIRLIQLGGKMGKPNDELINFILGWHKATGIALDMVYTGPMCMAISKMISESYFNTGSKILLIHTGGLQGNRSVPGLPVQ